MLALCETCPNLETSLSFNADEIKGAYLLAKKARPKRHRPTTRTGASVHRCKPVGEGHRIAQRGVFTKELQLADDMRPAKLLEEEPSEQPRKHAHRQEEARPAGDASVPVRRQPVAGDVAMDVQMMRQCRAQGVQHQRGADLGTQMQGICGNTQ